MAVEKTYEHMQDQHGKMYILDQHTPDSLNLDRIWYHQQRSKRKCKITTSHILRSPKLRRKHMRQMEMKRHISHTSHNYDGELIDKLDTQDHAQVLFIVDFLFAVEFAHQLYFIHFIHFLQLWVFSNMEYYVLCMYGWGWVISGMVVTAEYNQLLQQLMLSKNRNNKGVWKRKRSQYSNNIALPQDPSMQELKTVSKRLAIISRLEKKDVRHSQNRSVNKTFSKLDLDYSTQLNRQTSQPKRPATSNQTNLRNMRNIKHAKQAMKQEKRINQYLMSEKGETAVKKSFTNTSTSVKQGLLGEYDRYNQMTKHELIEKLISLEYLANNIFRKNKVLEDKIKALDPNYNTN